MQSQLPVFAYHPDPIATGSVVRSDAPCACCGNARGYIYMGPVYCESYDEIAICPWCIADGVAHTKLGAEFTDTVGVGGGGAWDPVPKDVVETVAYRTPGFNGWQQEQWWTHCHDAAEFIGPAGRKELEGLGSLAVAVIRDHTGLEGREWDEFLAALDKDSGPTAYLFRCRKCGLLGGYQDCH